MNLIFRSHGLCRPNPPWVVALLLLACGCFALGDRLLGACAAPNWVVTTQEPGSEKEEVVQAVVYARVEGQPIGLAEVRFLLGQLRAIPQQEQEQLQFWSTANPVTDLVENADAGQPPSENTKSAPEQGTEQATWAGSSEAASIPVEVRQAAVEKWIQRMVVLSFLEQNDLAVSEAEVLSDINALERRLEQAGSDLAARLARSGIGRASFVRHRKFEMSWDRYLENRVTDTTLSKFFEQRHSEFDGTRLRVAHIVIVSPDPNREILEDDFWQNAREKLATVRQEIVDGKQSFASAAQQYSEGSTADTGGDLGWIGRKGPLSEALSAAAFQLSDGSISPPIRSPHGVHLVTVVERTLGTVPFLQVKAEVRSAAIESLWQAILDRHREKVSIQKS